MDPKRLPPGHYAGRTLLALACLASFAVAAIGAVEAAVPQRLALVAQDLVLHARTLWELR
jgi:hypothetical protein